MGARRRASLTVEIPAYNEELRLPRTLLACGEYVNSWTDGEVIVVDDGTRDATRAVAEAGGARVLTHPRNRGKGYVVRTGILAASKERILFRDADLSTPIQELEKLWVALGRGFDVAIGFRGLPGCDFVVRQPLYRESMARIFHRIIRLAALRGIRDTQCGFKLFPWESCACEGGS